MKNFISILVSIFLIISACSDKETLQMHSESVDFSNLKHGQKTFFQQYTSSCDSLTENFSFTGNTLVLEVMERGNQFYLNEYLTEDSPMFIDGSFTDKNEYPIDSEGDLVKLPERENSVLFFFYANDTLTLQPDANILVDLTQNDCQLRYPDNGPFIGNDIGKVELFEIGDVRIQNKMAVSCEPYFELDAYLFYNNNELICSHVIDGEFFWGDPLWGTITGWVKIQQ